MVDSERLALSPRRIKSPLPVSSGIESMAPAIGAAPTIFGLRIRRVCCSSSRAKWHPWSDSHRLDTGLKGQPHDGLAFRGFKGC